MDVILDSYQDQKNENIISEELLNGHVFKTYSRNSCDASETAKRFDVPLQKIKRLILKVKKFKNIARDGKQIQSLMNERFHKCFVQSNISLHIV